MDHGGQAVTGADPKFVCDEASVDWKSLKRALDDVWPLYWLPPVGGTIA
jgi:hypothetical protein